VATVTCHCRATAGMAAGRSIGGCESGNAEDGRGSNGERRDSIEHDESFPRFAVG
jgi:hypothetical protein